MSLGNICNSIGSFECLKAHYLNDKLGTNPKGEYSTNTNKFPILNTSVCEYIAVYEHKCTTIPSCINCANIFTVARWLPFIAGV